MRVLRLVDLVDTESTVRDQVVEDALIVGPGVVTILHNVKFEACVFEGDSTALFIEVPETKRQIGIVGLANMTFKRCRFQNVAIIGTRDVIARLKRELRGEPELHLTGATGPASPVGHYGFTGPTHIGPTGRPGTPGATGPTAPAAPGKEPEPPE
jgi:hypothetical protein